MPLFTAETAAINGHKGALARWSRRNDPQDLAITPLLPAPMPALDDYQVRRLHRVRVQLDQLDEAITRETAKERPDGQRLNWLAQAQDRLSEQERILAGRPLPGSRRPSPDRTPRNAQPSNLDALPSPSPSPAPVPILIQPPAEPPTPGQ